MNIRDMKYIETVASLKNFSQAAVACNVSQPALSSQIKKLEQELGTPLFLRSTNKVRLTEFGESILTSVQGINNYVSAIHDIASSYRNVDMAPLKIGLTPTLAPFLTSYFYDMMSTIFPDVRVMLVEAKPRELFEKVEGQDIDLALISRVSYNLNGKRNEGHSLDFVSLWLEKLYLIANNQSELGQKSTISASDVPADLLLRFGIPFGYDLSLIHI